MEDDKRLIERMKILSEGIRLDVPKREIILRTADVLAGLQSFIAKNFTTQEQEMIAIRIANIVNLDGEDTQR
jgi:hypothetical protein